MNATRTTYWPHLIAIACLLALAMTLDYDEQVANEKAATVSNHNKE